jgi:polyhydroxybutyrate depolymerase
MRVHIVVALIALVGCTKPEGAEVPPPDTGDVAPDAAIDPDASVDASVIDGGVVGSAGCGKPAVPGVTTATIQVAGKTRSYVVSIPAGYVATTPLPLVFGWHGQGGTGPHFQAGTLSYGGWGGGVEQASNGGGIFVYPTGLVKDSVMKTGWYVGAGQDVELFDKLIVKLSNDLCVDASRIFSFGYSYGARMTNELGCLRPNVLRAIAPIAGYGPIGPCAGGAVPVWMHNAQNDNVVPIARGVAARDHWRTANSCSAAAPVPVPPSPCVAYQGCGESLVWCSPATGLHSFPTYVYAGIWSFFAAQ